MVEFGGSYFWWRTVDDSTEPGQGISRYYAGEFAMKRYAAVFISRLISVPSLAEAYAKIDAHIVGTF